MEPVTEITEQGVYVGIIAAAMQGSHKVAILVSGTAPFLTAKIIRLYDGHEINSLELYKVTNIQKIQWP